MEHFLERTELLFGEEAVEKLKNAHVAVFGLGGVGSYVLEALTRSGIGRLTLFDADTVQESNLNRQLEALHSTLGQQKTEVCRARIADINPKAQVECRNLFFLPENADTVDFSAFDYVVDAIDTVTAKLEIITRCDKAQVPVISAMGTGNKFFPELLEIADIFDTSVCPLARTMRAQLRRRNIQHLKVVYSKEEPKRRAQNTRKPVIGSSAFVPATAGLLLAGAVVRDILGIENPTK